MAQKMKHTMGEKPNIRFNRKIKLEFHGARLTSDGGLLAYREFDETLGLFNSASDVMNDKRTGRNIQHDMTSLLRQSVYTRLAGYEDVNDAQRLSVDPVMRAVTGKKKNAAGVNTVVRFYNGRGIAEQWIKEGKYALNWTRLSCKHFLSNQVRLGLFVLAYNLGNFLRRLVLPGKVKHWSLRTLLVKLIKIGA